MTLEGFKISHLGIRKAGPEFLGLRMHVQDQLRTIDPVRKAWEIFDHRGGGKLTARLAAFEHKWTEVRAGGINRRRQSRATAANNDDLLHI